MCKNLAAIYPKISKESDWYQSFSIYVKLGRYLHNTDAEPSAKFQIDFSTFLHLFLQIRDFGMSNNEVSGRIFDRARVGYRTGETPQQ